MEFCVDCHFDERFRLQQHGEVSNQVVQEDMGGADTLANHAYIGK
jgi:hypothetical protein